MPLTYDKKNDPSRKSKPIKSAFDSDSFDADWTIHVDGLVGSATISPSGRDVALASPEGLAIIDLDSPYSPPRRLSSRGLPWLVVDVQWSPFAVRDYWVASTANHRCLVWNLNLRDDSASGPIEHSLQGHSRAITDINFSAYHPDLLATCAVDGYVHNWDLRRPRQPALTFCDWSAGATQVKYSRRDPHVLASSHDRLLHIWDDRKPAEPIKTIVAHSSKIYGLDWNRVRPEALVTCSLDRTIKFWDYREDAPERVIHTQFPVWRARHTPFGWGVLAMPQNEPGNLHLFDSRCADGDPSEGPADPVYTFHGHGDYKAKEFLWRSRGNIDANGIDDRDFQLVSWGEDRELRLERVEADVLASVGYVKGQPAPPGLLLTRQGAAYKTFRTVDDGVPRDRRNATMSDPRAGAGGQSARRTTLTNAGVCTTPNYKPGSAWRPPSMKAKTGVSKEANRGLAQIGWMRGVTMSKRRPQGGSRGPMAGRREDAASPTAEDSLFGSAYHDNQWGEPDTLQDEFVRLTSQLPNVKWHSIDMDNLTINASFKGPWGVNAEPIHINVRVDIPKKYPHSKAPRFFIDRSSLMPEETREKIESELYKLVWHFSQRKKNSLGPAFAYLLGEADLATSTSFDRELRGLDDEDGKLMAGSVTADDDDYDDNDNIDDTDNDCGGNNNNKNNNNNNNSNNDDNDENDDDDDAESLSDSDSDIIPPGGSAAMSQELPEPSSGAETSAALAGGFRQTVIPVKRTCGARFSNDGKLACFFPTKEEKARALFVVSLESNKERAKVEPRFAGFGRLSHPSSPPPSRPSLMMGRRHRRGGGNNYYSGSDDDDYDDDEDDDDGSGVSDSEDMSSSSSSDSELTSMNRISFWYRPGRSTFRKSWSANESVRSSGGGTGTGTHAGTAKSSRRTAATTSSSRPKNIVSIRDMRHLLPSKQQYAREYAIFGNGADVCEHNARVAERYGDEDLTSIWRYVALLLRSDIPLRLAESGTREPTARDRGQSILVIARDAVSRFNGSTASPPEDGFVGRVKWGHHPLAHEFVHDVFAHFERLADVQMLAMLSCVFGDSRADDSLAYAKSRLTQPETPLPMKAPSFSLEYFPANPELWQHHQQHRQQQLLLQQSNWQHQHHYLRSQPSSAITTPRTSQTPNQYSYSTSLGSEPGVWPGEAGSYSCGETPPVLAAGAKGSRSHQQQQHHQNHQSNATSEADYTQSLSTSPNTRLAAFRRTNSAISAASGLAASLPRALHTMVSSSPPEPAPVRKRPSPAETIFSNLGPAVTWGASTVFGTATSRGANTDASTNAAAVAAELRAAATAAAAAAAAATAAAATSTGAGTRTPSVTDGADLHSGYHHHLESSSMVAVNVSVQVFNEGCFDDDGWMAAPFLDPGRNSLYASYRHAYAEMLQIWGLPLARLEIMKFNVLKGEEDGDEAGAGAEQEVAEVVAKPETAQRKSEPEATANKGGGEDQPGSSSPAAAAAATAALATAAAVAEEVKTGTLSPTLVLSRRQQLEGLMASGRGLDVTGICRVHETNLEPLQTSGRPLPQPYGPAARKGQGAEEGETRMGGAVGTCERCHHAMQAQLRCVYCQEPVTALYPACLGCGCASHEACLAEWHAAGERYCPAGDECDCAAEASNGKIESWAAMQAALVRAAGRERERERQRAAAAAAAAAATKARKTVRVMGGPPKVTVNVPRNSNGAVMAPPVASPSAARPRRRSMPGGIGLQVPGSGGAQGGEGDGYGDGDGEGEMSGGWEKVTAPPRESGAVTAGNMTPTMAAAGGSASRLPSAAAAQLHRLRRHVGDMGRPSILRQKSGSVLQKKGS